MVELKGLNIVVTGGAGFIGKHLVDELIVNNNVTVIDNLSSGSEETIEHHLGKENFRFVKGDVQDQNISRKVLDGVDVIYHLAAISDVESSVKEPDKTYNKNFGGTVNLLRAFEGKLFVFTSSIGVYESGLNPYLKSKYLAEWAIKKSRKPHVILRLANVYGKGSRSVVQKFIEGETISIFGDGNQTRDFVFIDDVVDHLIKVGKLKHNSIYHVGSGVRTTINDLARLVKKIVGEKKVIYLPLRQFEITHPKVKVDLEGKTSLEDGIKKCLISKKFEKE
jgi:UDP-glucose 4-epimerase